MKTTVLAYVLMLAGVALIAFGAYRFASGQSGVHPVVRRAHLAMGDVALGLALIGLGQALRLLLFIWAK